MPAETVPTAVPITLTAAQLGAICQRAPPGALVPLNLILARTQSNTERRAAMVVAQLAVRSDSFTRLEEENPARRASTAYLLTRTTGERIA